MFLCRSKRIEPKKTYFMELNVKNHYQKKKVHKGEVFVLFCRRNKKIYLY